MQPPDIRSDLTQLDGPDSNIECSTSSDLMSDTTALGGSAVLIEPRCRIAVEHETKGRVSAASAKYRGTINYTKAYDHRNQST